MIQRKFMAFAAAATLSLVAGSGCGPSPGSAEIEETVPAAGTITYRGQPLENYRVVLYPEDARPAAGKTDAAGRFTLGTNEPGDGAVVGAHRLAVTYVGPELDQPAGKDEFQEIPPPEIAIPEKYHDPDTSEVTVEIPEEGSNDLRIDLN